MSGLSSLQIWLKNAFLSWIPLFGCDVYPPKLRISSLALCALIVKIWILKRTGVTRCRYRRQIGSSTTTRNVSRLQYMFPLYWKLGTNPGVSTQLRSRKKKRMRWKVFNTLQLWSLEYQQRKHLQLICVNISGCPFLLFFSWCTKYNVR